MGWHSKLCILGARMLTKPLLISYALALFHGGYSMSFNDM
jgi:hypothetical protein